MTTAGARKRQILVLSHSPFSGGAELALAGLMASTTDQYDWHVVFPIQQHAIPALTEHAASVTYLELPWWCHEAHDTTQQTNEELLRKNMARLIELARTADILLTNTITIPWLGFIAQQLHKPHIWYVHEFGDLDHNLQFIAGYDRSLQLIERCSSLVITISESVKGHLSRIISPEHIRIIHQSIDLSRLTALPLTDDDPGRRLLCIGAIKPSKGQLLAVEAVKQLSRPSDQQFSLTVMGPVADQQYRDLVVAAAAGAANITIKEGFGDSIHALSTHDTVLMCSENEALGRVTLEALAAGKLVVGYDCPATRELLRDGRGVLYQPNTAEVLARTLAALPATASSIDRQAARTFAADNYSDLQQSQDFAAAVDIAMHAPAASDATAQPGEEYLETLRSKNLYSTKAQAYGGKTRLLIAKALPQPLKKALKKLLPR